MKKKWNESETSGLSGLRVPNLLHCLLACLLKKMKKNHDCCFIRWNSADLGGFAVIDHTYRSHAHQKGRRSRSSSPAGQPHLSQSIHTQPFPHPNTLSIAPNYNDRGSWAQERFPHGPRTGMWRWETKAHPETHTHRQKQFSQSAAPDRILTGGCFWTMAFNYDYVAVS